MNNNSLNQLISKLDKSSHKLLEQSVALTHRLKHAAVDIQHFLLTLMCENTSFKFILDNNDINTNSICNNINKILNKLPTSLIETPALSATIVEWLKEAWLHASIRDENRVINSTDPLLAIISSAYLQQIVAPLIPAIEQLSVDKVIRQIDNLDIKPVADKQSSTEALKQYTINLNTQAKLGKLAPAQAREKEIHQIINILQRKKQNNPILIGEPGVGKTALVEGLALKIVNHQVPDILNNVEILSLDMGLLMAGASIKGEFEKRLKAVITEIKQHTNPIILFIDEAHTLIGSGNPTGGLDSANLLKPALARGELKTIAATTLNEYKLYLEKDAAFTRRFQTVYINEPDDEQALIMLRSAQPALEKHHKVFIKEQALLSAIKLSRRYIADRFLPDKAISLLDTACAHNALQRQTEPFALSQARNQLKTLQTEAQQIKKNLLLENNQEKLDLIKKQISSTKNKIKVFTTEYKQEHKLIQELDKLMLNKKKTKQSHKIFNSKLKKLEKLQQIHCHIPYCINSNSIETIITNWTGIPLDRLTANTNDKIKQLKKELNHNVVGQKHATETIMQSMTQHLLKINDPNKPLGVFLFTGPSGVGKTHTAQIIAELFFGSKEHITILNMSEFKESHKISMLLGSPPGYVGYGEGGVLTEPVRRQPYHLVLIDEIEKAHHSIHEVFYQIFDQGIAKDSQGRDINFKNTIFILTSNIGDELCSNIENHQADTITDQLQTILLQHFKPAFLGRLKTVPFTAIDKQGAKLIIQQKLDVVKQRIDEQHQIEINFDVKTVNSILKQSDYKLTGARNFDHIINQKILPNLTKCLLMNDV